MDFKVLYMSVQDVFSEGKLYMAITLQKVLSAQRW